MNPEWQSFLQQQGAVLDAGSEQHFGQPEAERRAAAGGDVLVDLSGRALIRATGADTRPFLNGQLSNDLRLLDATHSRLAAWCSPKGRMLVIFRMFQRREEIYLCYSDSLRASILKRLRMFVLRAKVTLTEADQELIGLGVAGPNAEKHLRATAGFVPDEIDGCITRDEITIIRIAGPHPRYEIFAPAEPAMKLWNEMKSRAKPATSSVWNWLDIQAGIPSVHPETSEAFVPQMANLEIVGGVNFKKGCYPGQEIVARMQYLGRLKQRMYRVHIGGDVRPKPGDSVFAPDFPGQSAGTVVAAEPSPDGGFDLLAVIQISSAGIGEIHFGAESGPRVSLQNLPYSLPASTRTE